MLDAVRLEREQRTPAPDSLRDRVVLLTGAPGGLGRATAIAAAQAGATVILLGRKVRPLEALYDELEALGAPTPALYPLDMEGATPGDYADLAATLEREFGRLDGLAHCAAHFNTLQPLTQIASMANLLQSGVASAERVFEVLDAPEMSEEAPGTLPAAVEGRVVRTGRKRAA